MESLLRLSSQTLGGLLVLSCLATSLHAQVNHAGEYDLNLTIETQECAGLPVGTSQAGTIAISSNKNGQMEISLATPMVATPRLKGFLNSAPSGGVTGVSRGELAWGAPNIQLRMKPNGPGKFAVEYSWLCLLKRSKQFSICQTRYSASATHR